MADTPDMLAAALAYARKGVPVFPCSPSTAKGKAKQPLVPKESTPGAKDGGLYLATTEEARIRAWWERWPKALIAMPTGRRAGVFVLDLDAKDHPADDMLAAVARWCGGVLPPCPVVRTQSGGLHLWYAYPDLPEGAKLGNRAGLFGKVEGVDPVIAAHVDVRGEGGYVIVPPSVMADGKRYDWEQEPDDDPPPAAPETLLDLILRRGAFGRGGERTAAGAASRPVTADDAVRRYALAALDAEARDVAAAPKGGRNSRLNEAAFALGQLVGAGALSEAVVRAALEEAAARCGLADDDGRKSVRDTIGSGLTNGLAKPRDLSEIARKARDRAARRSGGSWREDAPWPDDPGPAAPDGGGRGGGRGSPPSGGGPAGDEPDWDAIEGCARLEQNDTGNGQRLLRHFGGRIIHVRALGWFSWSGTHFEQKGGSEAVERFAQATARLIGLEGPFIGPTDVDRALIEAAEPLKEMAREQLSERERAQLKAGIDAEERLAKRRADRRKFAISCGNSNRLTGMVARALAHCTIAQDELDADPLAINVVNGVIDIARVVDLDCPDPDVTRFTAEVRFSEGHDPKRLMSKRMEVDYVPGAECPKWRGFMERFQPREEMRRYLQKLHGYCLLALTAEQALWFNYGGGANGKSTFIRTLATLMGGYATQIPFASLVNEQSRAGNQASPDIALLPRMRMVYASEPPKDVRWDEATVKHLTGGDKMQARGLYQSFFEFRPTHKLIVSGNDKPPISGVDHGTWRRMRLVPWTETISDDDKRDMDDVVAEFLEEGPGILNWLLDGLKGYFDEGLRPPDAVLQATREYHDENDPVGPFLRACVVSDPGGSVTAREMYEAYCNWAEANGMKPIYEARFGRLLPQKGLRKTDERIRRYLDVKLHDVPAAPSRSPHDLWPDPP